MPIQEKKILVIVGPTASGKSDLAIAIAKKVNGEIISADSRQVYRGMDIGTGKVTKREQQQVAHHLLDIANPRIEYNVSHFLKDAQEAIDDIRSRGKTPIICGGTTFWIETLIFGLSLPQVKPDKTFREKWEKKETGELYGYLKRLDPKRAKTIDRHNKVRLLRALEIARALGRVPPLPANDKLRVTSYEFIGLNPPVEELNQKIRTRLATRMKLGMVKEVEQLHNVGVSWQRLESFGLEYRAIARFLEGKISKAEMMQTLSYDIIHYAKRQRSSLRRLEKRGVKIQWFSDIDVALANLRLENL